MTNFTINRLGLLFAVVTLLFGSLSSQATALGSYRTIADTMYSMEYSFISRADSTTLLDILFDFSHLQKYAGQSDLTITLLAHSPSQQTVLYSYDGFLFKGSAIINRVLRRSQSEITFALQSAQQNNKLLPRVIASTGWYRIIPGEYEGVPYNTVKYYQVTTTDRAVGRMYHHFARQQVTDFFTRLEKFIRASTE